ncbi:MAG: SdpI family protein [Firmicutes bacterium]|nr:SdpI family protein [Bacillota bacterium]
MWKRNKGVLIITTLIAALPILVGLILWNQLPDQMATHFNIAGEADGWSGKAFAVIGLPMILVGIHLICALATLADPKKQNISDKMFRLVLWICPVLSIFVNGGVYLYSLGFPVDMSRICMIMVSVVFLIIGNYMPKCRQNYTVGIKVPWTLADPENWNKTHRLAGWLWILSGVLMGIAAILNKMNVVIMFCVILMAAFVPMIYSYVYYVRHGERNPK